MTALLVRDAEIAARLTPFRTVRRNAAPAATRVRDEVGKLMAQGAIDLGFAMRAEEGIQSNDVAMEIRAPGRGPQPRTPHDAHEWSEEDRADGLQHLARLRF